MKWRRCAVSEGVTRFYSASCAYVRRYFICVFLYQGLVENPCLYFPSAAAQIVGGHWSAFVFSLVAFGLICAASTYVHIREISCVLVN